MNAETKVESRSAARRVVEVGASPILQRTIATPVIFSGRALHLGGHSTVEVLPAGVDYGIKFSHAGDDAPPSSVACCYGDHTTSISLGTGRILTAEHLLSAMYALGITNAHVHLHGQRELPILDGSSLPFMRGLIQASIVEQDGLADCLMIKDTIWFHEEGSGSIIIARPSHTFIVDAEIVFPGNIVGTQRIRKEITSRCYLAEIAPSRTFLKESIDVTPLSLVKRDRLRGLNCEDPHRCPVVVYSDDLFITPLRFNDEMIRHKVLDFVGDMSTLGRRVMGEFYLYRPGHRSNLNFCKHLLNQLDSTEVAR